MTAKMTDQKPAQDCQSLADIRREIDHLDQTLVALLAKRMSYITRAAEVKQVAGIAAELPVRIQEVLSAVRSHARAHHLDPDVCGRIWDILITYAIAHEKKLMHEMDKENCESGH